MSDNNVLKLVYTFFLGILLAIFIGVGISTFYPGPKAPEFPTSLNTYGKDPTLTTDQIAVQKDYDAKMAKFNESQKPYSRNVSIITLVSSVILLSASLLLEKKIRFISDGVLLGGLFTLIYSIGRSFASSDNKYVFIVLSISIVAVVYLGYHKFVRAHDTSSVKIEAK